MAHGQLLTFFRTLHGRAGDERTDGELLQEFAGGKDESAFAALMRRHGPLVLGVCRRVLGDAHDAEDVFQATFLVLVKKAGGLDRRGSLGPWLYTVAYHLALRARTHLARRRAEQREVGDVAAQDPPNDLHWNELRGVLDEEMSRLPEKYRAPVVLCYLEGKTSEQAAEQLGWPKGTVFTRLTRARDLLRQRLTRRGLALAAAALVPALEQQASAAVPGALHTATLQAALLVAAGQESAAGLTPSVVALVEGGLHKMLVAKMKFTVALLLAVAIVGLGVGGIFYAPAQAEKPAAADAKDAKAGKDAKTKPAGDPFGYTAAFEEEVRKIGQITPQEFARRYPTSAKYQDKFSWDPTTAKFWDDFNKDMKGVNAGRGGNYDFRLNADELAKFKQNGFVVSERMGAASFAEQYYRIYARDLPVYISSDSLLHAWHRTYDAILEEMEETYLITSLDEILAGMASGLPAAQKEYGNGVLSDSVTDADYFLTVARSLLAGEQVKTHLAQEARVAHTLQCVKDEQIEEFNLFGRARKVDFSQFKVRGHYENSEKLKKYFKAMMWCGRTDMRIAGGMDANGGLSSPRELGSAIVLHDLLRRSGKFEQWEQFDRMIQTFVGRTDSATFAQLDGILAKAEIKSPAAVKDLDTLKAIQDDILAGKIGMQHVRGDIYTAPFGPQKTELPRSFTLLGQKFVMDSWVTAKTVYGDIVWDEEKVYRRIPSCLDVAFATLGNDQVVPELVERMNNKQGRKFRDGLNYQHNLAATRNIIDAQDKAVWDENLYMNWLGTLRELSQPTTDAKYPEALRTRAWAMKSVNTQLASWSQLRHDTILYVKQSYTETTKCYYPAGYVEPVPHFWARLEKTATKAADLIEKTPYPDREVEEAIPDSDRRGKINLRTKQKHQAEFLRNFAKQVGIIKTIAQKELDQKELTKEETTFLEDVVQIQRGSGVTRYNGWFPGLFYKGRLDSGKWDAIVADVHTNVPDPNGGDPRGCVLHQGVGNVDLMLIAIDNGKDRMVYAGPVLSHYEFEMEGVARKSDSEWRKDIREGKLPPRPEWTKLYLVPGVNREAARYKHENDKE